MAKYQFLDKKIESARKGDQVRILGTIIEKRGDHFVLEDGTGQIKVKTNQKKLEEFEEGQLVRVFGQVKKDKSLDLRLIQDLSGLDLSLYKRVNKTLKNYKDLFKNEDV